MSQPGSPPSGHPPGLPFLFVDRSLGRIAVPALLRQAGLRLITLAEHYGLPADECVQDVTWLADSAKQGWVVLMKDKNIRRNPAEKAAVRQHGARCFCLTGGNLPAYEMAARFIANLGAMATACTNPGLSSTPSTRHALSR